MDNRLLYQSAIFGGVISALMDALPYIKLVNVFCCIGIALGGFAAFYYYRSHSPNDPEEFSLAGLVHLGLLTGLIGAVAGFVAHYIVYKLVGNWDIELLKNMMDKVNELPPIWDDLYGEIESGQYDGFIGPAILVQSLMIFPVFTFIGVLIGNKFLGNAFKRPED
ncbi:MAG: hypothetical protein P8X42_12150 [Calditrichaceae bacterium]|jgi:hypothetical protein